MKPTETKPAAEQERELDADAASTALSKFVAEKLHPKTCGATSQAGGGFSAGAFQCDRERGHAGDHRAYWSTVDEVWFWPLAAKGAPK